MGDPVFRVTLLPAQQGDAIWIEYGPDDAPFRILIDAGTPPTAPIVHQRILDLTDGRRFELFIVTHIDTDHIGGVLKLLTDPPAGMEVGDVWFNERRQLEQPKKSHLGAIDGEILGVQLDALKWNWNTLFGSGLVVLDDGEGAPPSSELPGGMSITLLSPGFQQVETLKSAWAKELDQKGLDPTNPDYLELLSEKMHAKGVAPSTLGDEEAETVEELASHLFVEDESSANGSSIAVLAEFEQKSCLLTGDAVPSAMIPAIRRLLKSRHQDRLGVDAVKLPHHGSENNISDEFLELLVSPLWLFSTNGNVHHHPQAPAVARVIRANAGRHPTLGFNYPKGVNPKADRWDEPQRKEDGDYETVFAEDGGGLLVDL
jgi:beta-lactamase superfamily II metal-dependent hydrolase